MTRAFNILAVAELLLAVGCADADQAAPTLILHNAKIFTAHPDNPWAEAIAIEGERIRLVGTNEAVLPLGTEETQSIDLRERLIIPGINDAHAHATPWPDAIRLNAGEGQIPDPSWEEILSALKEALEAVPERGWIMGTIGQTVMEDERATRYSLDKVVPDHPVLLESWTGHGLILNTAALQFLEIAVNATDPPGGWYGRDEAGLINGVLWEYAHVNAVRHLASAQGQGAAVTVFQQLQDQLFRWGVTSVQYMSHSLSLADTVAALEKAGSSVRWGIIRWPVPQEGISEAWSDPLPSGGSAPRIRVAGMKWMLDGTPLERGAYMRQAYADRPDWRGRLNFSEEQIQEILQGALDRNEQAALHIAGDGTLELVFRLMAELAGPDAWRPRRLRIEHGDGLSADLIPQARDLGVVVIQNPLHFTSPDIIQARLGPDRAADYQRLKTLLRAGIPIAFGADANAQARNPYLNMMVAAQHPANPGEAISLENALTAYTSGSAFAERQETEKGKLAEGFLADLAVLSQDIFDVPLEQLPQTESVLTVVGGEIVYRSPDLNRSN